MSVRGRAGAVVVAVLLGQAAALPTATARADSATLQAEIVTQRARLLDASGRLAGLARLDGLLNATPPAGGAAAGSRFGGHAQLWETIVEQLRAGAQARQARLEPLLARVEDRRGKAVAAWRALADGSIAAELGDAPDPREPGRLGPDLLLDLLPIAGWSVLALVGSMVLRAHEGRLELRWWLRSWGGGTGALLALASALHLIACAPATARDAPTADARLARTLADLQTEVRTAERQADERNEALTARLAELARARVAALLPIAAPPGSDPAGTLRALEEGAQAQVRDLLVAAGQAVAFSDDGARAARALRDDWDARRQAWESARTRALARGGLGLGGSLCGLGLVFLPAARARHRRRRRARAIARQCPRCLDSRLETVTSAVHDIHGRGLRRVECQNPSCLYWFRASDQFLPRLCIPTLGIYGSGKTRWLLTVYEQVRNANLPPELRVTLDILSSPFDEVFEHMIRECLETHAVTAPTQVELPAPRIFFHRDRDPLGRKEVLVNLFDYSGETMFAGLDAALRQGGGAPTDAVAALRRRALLSDSFVLFLDPTQVRAGEGYSINDQILAVNDFIKDVRVVRGLRSGQRIDLSIAVCIAKIDLLTTRNPMGGFADDWVRMLRQSAQYPPSLALIQQRSRFCSQALRSMFSGWDIERTLRSNFGTRFMFFPLSPVGIEEGELGVEPLDRRSRAPFGVLEPLLWLLHMHGYSVFGGRRGP